MKLIKLLIVCCLPLVMALTCADAKRQSSEKTSKNDLSELNIGFYNLDNLFDTSDNPIGFDEDFLPQGKYRWNTLKYQSKLKNLSKVINSLSNGNPIDVLGVCEVENKAVLDDLIQTCHFTEVYRVVHFESKDERGIDVGLLYNSSKLKVIDSMAYTVHLSKDSNDKTRDILWLKAVSKLNADTFQFIVCHFPSRREGVAKSEINRLDAGETCRRIIDERCQTETQNLIIMGDFNDEPWNKSISSKIGAVDYRKQASAAIQNLMYGFKEEGKGTYRFKTFWDVLDQFMISKALNNGSYPDFVQNSVQIKTDPWLFQTGKYKGFPLRTFGGDKWLDGYSDHLPISMKIKLKE